MVGVAVDGQSRVAALAILGDVLERAPAEERFRLGFFAGSAPMDLGPQLLQRRRAQFERAVSDLARPEILDVVSGQFELSEVFQPSADH